VARPYDYFREYRNLDVRLVNGTVLSGIDVHEYRNAKDVFNPLNTDADMSNDVDEMGADFDAGPGWTNGWGPLRSKIAKHGVKLGRDRYQVKFPLPTKENPNPAVRFDQIIYIAELARVYTGKGTPYLIAQALQLAEAFGLVQPTVAAMQTYGDNYVGLDCNGFVGNYLRARGCTVAGPETPAFPYAFVPPNWRLKKLEDVKAESVLVWKNAGHVAIVDRISGIQYNGVLPAAVCESTGARAVPSDVHTDGLNYTVYEIHPPGKDGVFKVKRGLGGAFLNDVYIGNLLPSFS
jgi:hypothetical protein